MAAIWDAGFSHRNVPSVVYPVPSAFTGWHFSHTSWSFIKHWFLCTFKFQFPSETVFKKFKNTDVCVILNLKWQQPEMLVLKPYSRNQPNVVHQVASVYIGSHFPHRSWSFIKNWFLCTFRLQFPSETVFKKFKNTNVCVILNLKWQQPEMLLLKP